MNTSVQQLATAGNPQNNTLDQIKMLENTARLCLTDSKDLSAGQAGGHIPYLLTLRSECLQLLQQTRPATLLHAKFNCLALWFETSDLKAGVDLVCVEEELRELLQLVIEQRQAMSADRKGAGND